MLRVRGLEHGQTKEQAAAAFGMSIFSNKDALRTIDRQRNGAPRADYAARALVARTRRRKP
jgi:hypothetical protein